MNRIKTYRSFFESTTQDRLRNLITDAIQPLIDDFSDIKYGLYNGRSGAKILVLFESEYNYKGEIINFFNNSKDLFESYGLVSNLYVMDSQIGFEFQLKSNNI